MKSQEELRALFEQSPVAETAPVQEKIPVQEKSQEDLKAMFEQGEVDVVKDALPTSLQILNPAQAWDDEAENFDTGIELSEDMSAFLTATGHMMVDTARGLEQIFGSDEDTIKREKENEKNMNALYSDPRYRTAAMTGAITGAVVEPIGAVTLALMPKIKANTLLKVATVGTVTGGFFGATGYVDEENGQTRLQNTLLGMAAGGILSTTIVGAAKGIDHGFSKLAARGAKNQLQNIELTIAKNRVTHKMKKADAEAAAYESLNISQTDLADLVIKAGSSKRFDPSKTTRKQSKVLVEEWQGRSLKQEGKRAKLREYYTVTKDKVDKFIQPVASRMSRIDPYTANEVRRGVTDQHIMQAGWLKSSHTLRDALRKLPDDIKPQMNKMLFTQDFKGARALAKKHGMDANLFKVAQKIHKESGDMLEKVGFNYPRMKNYWHRAIKDPEAVAKIQDSAIKNRIEKAVQKNKGKDLSPQQMSKLINDYIYTPKKGKVDTASAMRNRERKVLKDEMLGAYYDAGEALELYILQAAEDIARAKVFRKLGYRAKFKLDGSDGDKIVDKIVLKNWVTDKKAARDMREMLQALYVDSARAPSRWISNSKNIIYASLLGNPFSAATQFGDLVFPLHKYGLMDTVSAMFHKKKFKRADIGIVDAVVELSDTITPTKRILDWSLKLGGFTTVDAFGKETLINAAHRSFKRMAVKNPAKFKKKWGKVFGKETDQLMKDLADDKPSQNVLTMLFDELADVQPIALTEMPLKYLQHPNGRILYMLRTFTIKQLNYMRELIHNEPNKYKAAFNTAYYGALFVAANSTVDSFKDFMKGKELSLEDTVVDNAWQLVGANKFALENMSNRGFGAGLIDFVAPPFTIADKTIKKGMDGDIAGAFQEALYMTPVIGQPAKAIQEHAK